MGIQEGENAEEIHFFIYKIMMLACRYIYLRLFNSEAGAARSNCDQEFIALDTNLWSEI
jgi:hypothetical protein